MELLQKHSAHFYAGSGGDLHGVRKAKWRPQFAVEINKYRCRTLRHNNPGLKVFEGPIQSMTLSDYPQVPIHLYFVTFPCDHYTVAANMHQTWTGDQLYLEALREIVLHYPELIVIENVYGFRKFKRAIETFRCLPLYHCSEFVVYGDDFTMQRKKRVFLLLHRQPFQFAPIEQYATRRRHPDERLADYLEPAPQVKVPNYVYTRMDGGYRDLPIIYGAQHQEPVNLFTNYRRDRSLFLVEDDRYPRGVRPFTVREVANLHDFDPSYQFIGPLNEAYDMVVDSVMPAVAEAIGHAANAYFASINDLAPSPPALGHREVFSERQREEQLEEALRIIQEPDPIDPTQTEQLTLF